MAPSKATSDIPPVSDDDSAQHVITLDGQSRTFSVNGHHPFLTYVLGNVVATPSPYAGKSAAGSSSPGCFVGFDVAKAESQHVAPVGRLRDIRFMSIFRFKVWWTTHWVGSKGRDLADV